MCEVCVPMHIPPLNFGVAIAALPAHAPPRPLQSLFADPPGLLQLSPSSAWSLALAQRWPRLGPAELQLPALPWQLPHALPFPAAVPLSEPALALLPPSLLPDASLSDPELRLSLVLQRQHALPVPQRAGRPCALAPLPSLLPLSQRPAQQQVERCAVPLRAVQTARGLPPAQDEAFPSL